MKVLSLFDGISCGLVALHKAEIPIDNYYACEVNPYAIKVSNTNHPDITHIGDIRKISYSYGVLTTENGTYSVGDIDLIIGGSPCQSFTFAGKREGMTTTENIEITTLKQYLKYKAEGFQFKGESYLFWEYMRLLYEVRPKYFLLENVKMSNHWREIIDKALGIKSIMIDSALFSPQRRKRLYWTNIPMKKIEKVNTLTLKSVVREEDNLKYHLSEKHHNAFLKSYNWKPNFLWEKSKPLLASYYKQPPHCPYIPCKYSESGYRMLSPVECERLQTLPDDYTEGISKTQRYKVIGNAWTVDVIVFLLSGLKKHNKSAKIKH